MTVVDLPVRSGPKGPAQVRNGTIAALDIGSTKVSCFIAEPVAARHRSPDGEDKSSLRILGVGHQASRGIRNGMIVDVDQAERAIRLAVDAAERTAKRSISDVYVNIAGGRPQSTMQQASVHVATGQVTPLDIDTVIHAAATRVLPKGRAVLHVAPAQFHLDDARGVTLPLGMFGQRLSVDLNIVSAEASAMRNLALAVERCHLSVADYVVAPYASARAVLVEDEMKLGVTLIDMGGATTSIAAFQDGQLIFASVVPLGGQHVTQDIARGLSTTIAHAERMKTLWGSALATAIDDREMVAVPLLGERGVDTVHHVPKSMLTGIIRPRLEETFEMLRDQIEASTFARLAGNRVVLTGGASQLTGIREMAGQCLNRSVRLGSPLPLQGLPETARSAGFSVSAGLLAYALKPDRHYTIDHARNPSGDFNNTYLRRVGKWIAESF
ncbi:cell division protein FtsA [soil metagenome]